MTSRTKATPRRRRRAAPIRVGVVVAVMVAAVAVTAPLQVATAPASSAASLPTGFTDAVALAGLNGPTAVRFAPNGQVFVAEKGGVLKSFPSITSPVSTVVADFSTSVWSWLDHGLLGLAVDPQYPARPYVYVLYSYDAAIGGTAPTWNDTCPTPGTGCLTSARLSKLTIGPAGTMIDENVLIEDWCQTSVTHSIGDLRFGADGYLYASGGEGSSFGDYGQIGSNPCGDPNTPKGVAPSPPSAEGGSLRSQDLLTPGDPTTLDGGVIRIDPDTGLAAPGNPFFTTGNDENGRRLINEGLRNPFRFTFRPGTNELWIANVGASGDAAVEELNRQIDPTHFTNFGWPCFEGNAPVPGYQSLNLALCNQLYALPTANTPPYFSYTHGQAVVPGDGCATGSSAISAVSFTQGLAWPSRYDGAVIIGDYVRGCLWAMLAGTDGQPDPNRVELLASGVGGPVDLQVGADGALYYAAIGSGEIRRITYTSGNLPPNVALTTSTDSGPLPLAVTFDASASVDADTPGPLAYAWDLNGDGQFDEATGAVVSWTFTTAATVLARVRVTDSAGASAVQAVPIYAGNSRPTPSIAAPTASLRWSALDTIAFSGGATDPEDGVLPASALRWDVILEHCGGTTCHKHFVATFAGVASGSFVALDHEYPSYLELMLTATDSQGLTTSQVVRLDPATVQLVVDSVPPGLALTNQSAAGAGPLTQTVIRGATVLVGAQSPEVSGGATYQFAFWSDGGAQGHTVNLFSDTTLTATFSNATPTVSIGAATVLEGPGATIAFPVTLSGPVPVPVTVDVATADGTAVAGVDYSAMAGTLTIPAGQTTATFLVPVIDNSLIQPDRTLTATISNPVDAVLAPVPTATGTILDDETASLSVADAAPVLEGATNARPPATFTISLDRPSPVPVTFTATATSGTAVVGKDLLATTKTVTIPAGATSTTVTVLVKGDALDEATENFSLVLSAVSGARVTRSAATASIIDDDSPPSFSILDATRALQPNGTAIFSFVVKLSAASGLTTQITAATATGGTAVAGIDYIVTNKVFTLFPGQTTKTFFVKVRKPNTGRTALATIGAPANATIARATAVGIC